MSSGRYISRTLEKSPTAEPDGSNILTKETLLVMKALEAHVTEHIGDQTVASGRHASLVRHFRRDSDAIFRMTHTFARKPLPFPSSGLI